MPERLRFLLDTNVLIPLQDSLISLEPCLANFVRLAGIGGHQLLYHPASKADIERDSNAERRRRTLERLRQYSCLQAGPPCPWNMPTTSPNDACDNEILFALESDAAHALVTEDQKLHSKARTRGLESRVYFIQTAEDWLKRLHERSQIVLPNIQDIELHTLTSVLNNSFFDSLRQGYSGFNEWFRRKAQDGRRAWIYREAHTGTPSALCIYTEQYDERINEAGDVLSGAALKLCTFKVGEDVRGRKIGELFLRAAFQYASEQKCEHIFCHANVATQAHLISLFADFGFEQRGQYGDDDVYVKRHPLSPPASNEASFEYVRKYYPHYRSDMDVHKFLVPIKPEYHEMLFPDYESPGTALPLNHPRAHLGNAIKLAYLCHSPSNQIRSGDLILFYRTRDVKGITTIGIVERFEISQSAADIAQLVSRRTVYSMREIEEMAARPTKIILFRLIGHLSNSVSYEWLLHERIVRGPIQSIRAINDGAFSRIIRR